MTLGLMQGIEMASRLAAGAFVSGIWQGVVLVAVVGLCLHALPKTTAAIRFMVWGGVFLVLTMLPLLRSFVLKTDGAMAGHGVMAHAVHVDVRWSFVIAAVWLVLSGIRATQLGLSAVRLRRIWKRATPVVVGFEFGLVRMEGRRGRVLICTSVDVNCPSAIGFFSPRVLIPVEMFERLTATELEQIVLHEVGHLRRADDWLNLLQKIGLVVFPLNPALLWIERRLCFERELACDDGVLRLTKSPKAYATCLTTLAEHRLNRRGLSLSLGAWERQSELSRRVHSILRWREGMGRTQARVVLGVLVLGLLGGAAGMARCPQLVSFSEAALPLPQEMQALPARDFQDVVFHPTGAAHETLLKASMPTSGGKLKTAGHALRQGSHRSSLPSRSLRPALQRVRTIPTRENEQWLVLTSWNVQGAEPWDLPRNQSGTQSKAESGSARMVLTVSQEQSFYPSYAAVRTTGGWLFIQL
jgi:beta-lactamase regulating signal transducer with metallopeptidase domain